MKPAKQNLKIINKRFKKWRAKLDAGIMSIEDICNSYNGWRASIKRCDDSYMILYNRDLEFVRLFRNELRHFHRPFKCYIKCIKMEDGTFEYITKEKDNTHKSKTNNNPYYRNMINNQKKKANQNKKPKETQNNGERRTGSTNK